MVVDRVDTRASVEEQSGNVRLVLLRCEVKWGHPVFVGERYVRTAADELLRIFSSPFGRCIVQSGATFTVERTHDSDYRS